MSNTKKNQEMSPLETQSVPLCLLTPEEKKKGGENMESTVKVCPICKSEVDGKDFDNDVFEEINQLNQKGILKHTLHIAVTIVETMSDQNPVYLRQLLDEVIEKQNEVLFEHTSKVEESIRKRLVQDLQVILKTVLEIKGNPVAMGRIQEEAITKRLSSLKMGEDKFRTEKSRSSQEDIECIVVEDGVELGKIVVESKRTKHWREKYLQQIEEYMARENTEFGILATSSMPDDSLNYTVWRNGVLVVNIDYIEPAYVFLREHLKLTKTLEQEYSVRMGNLEVQDQILEELKNAITNGELDSIIKRLNKTTLDIDKTVANAENYMKRVFKTIKKDSSKIRECAERLVSEHIEKIRVQLLQQPLPPFLSS